MLHKFTTVMFSYYINVFQKLFFNIMQTTQFILRLARDAAQVANEWHNKPDFKNTALNILKTKRLHAYPRNLAFMLVHIKHRYPIPILNYTQLGRMTFWFFIFF